MDSAAWNRVDCQTNTKGTLGHMQFTFRPLY